MGSSPSSVLSRRPEVLLGSEEPRIFTPPLRRLTPQTSLGFAVIEFARDVLGMELLPWQRWLAIHALELLPDRTFRFRTVLLLVGRQNGKSTFLQVLALFFLYVRGVRLVIGTAQNLDIAEEVWQGAVDIARDVPELDAEIENVVLVNGKKALRLRGGERYKVQAANRRGGRGLSGDLVMLDELREHQTWAAWSAVTKTTMARASAMVWAVSNAGDATSVVLSYLRGLAHQALGDPDGLGETVESPLEVDDEADEDSLGIFEWSAPPGCDVRDPEGWAQANPSLGHTITQRAISAAVRTDPDPVFRTEVLCQWVERVTLSALPEELWNALADPDAERGSSQTFAVATAPDRSWSAIAVAWTRPDGHAQVTLTVGDGPNGERVVDYKPGAAWVTDRVTALRAKWGGTVVVNTAARGLVDDAEELSESDQAQAHNALADAVDAGTVHHGNEPALNVSVRAARWRPRGETRVLDRKGNTDISPLDAAALAYSAAASAPSIYEGRGLVTL